MVLLDINSLNSYEYKIDLGDLIDNKLTNTEEISS
jgi:hypothetical protein